MMMDWIFWMPEQATWNDGVIFVLVLWFIHQSVSLGSSWLFNRLHIGNRYPELRSQNGKEPPEKLLKSAWRELHLNHFLAVPLGMAIFLYPLFVWRGGMMDASMPSLVEVLRDIVVCILANLGASNGILRGQGRRRSRVLEMDDLS